ncbi:MAG: hypothetical protein JXR77_01035 [Lentisphaeria bacterium]|nr:hypothetical protein [Lentisphaeria bacterium]
MDSRHIVVDHREEAEALVLALIEEHGLAVTIEVLPLGDYRVGESLIVERKTTRDFCLSLVDGRLFDQAYRLAHPRHESILVVEGGSFDNDLAMDPRAIQGAFITLAQTYRLPVLRTRDQAESAWTLARLCEQRLRLGTRQGPLRGRAARRADLRRQRLLCAIPGVGPVTSKALLSHFGSVEAVLTASEKELARVHGVGSTRAHQIRDIVREEPGPWRV